MRTAEKKMITTKIAKRATVARDSITFLLVVEGSSGRLNDENEDFAFNDSDALAGLQRVLCARPPDLAMHPHASLSSVPSHGLALGAEQPLLACDHGTAPRAQQHREHQQEQRRGDERGGCHHRQREREAWRTGWKHHDRTDHERDNAADADHAEGADVRL